MGYFLIRKYYFPQAKNEWDAQDIMREVEEKGIVSLPRFGGVGKCGIYSTEGGEYAKATKDLYT